MSETRAGRPATCLIAFAAVSTPTASFSSQTAQSTRTGVGRLTWARDLEVALVTAARALGFVAKHISGDGEPDGLARFTEYPGGEKKIILEAKSSAAVPSLSAIDFAGLHEYMLAYEANGCLLVAPSYPGSTREEDSAAANRARQQKVSCWTVDQLAKVVAAAEARHLTAQDILNIVLKEFSPDTVTAAVGRLLAKPTWNKPQLYTAILEALKQMEGRLTDQYRSFDMIAVKVTDRPEFTDISMPELERAIKELAVASQGGITVRDGTVIIQASYEEIERRLRGVTKNAGTPRRAGTFKE